MHGDLGLRSPWSSPGNAANTSHLLDWLIACSPAEPMCQHPGFSGLGLHIVVMEIRMYRAGSHCAGGGAEACIMAAVTWPRPGRTQRRLLLGPWSLVSPAFSQSHPFLRACSSGTRSSPSQPLVPSLRAELCPSSFAPHCPAALPAPLPRGPFQLSPGGIRHFPAQPLLKPVAGAEDAQFGRLWPEPPPLRGSWALC